MDELKNVGRGRERFIALYKRLRERIVLLEYPPGAKLTETELAADFGVSRTPIRRVLQALEADGLVSTRTGVGTAVTSFDLGSLRDSYGVRMCLAERLGDFSANSAVSRLIPKARDLHDRMRRLENIRDFPQFVRINNELEHLVGQCCSNSELVNIAERLYYKTCRVYHALVKSNEIEWDEEVSVTCDEIMSVVHALEADDARGVGFVRRNFIWIDLCRISRYLLGK